MGTVRSALKALSNNRPHLQAVPYKGQRGMAVVMAVAVVLLVTTAALELHVNERTNLLNAAGMRDRITLDQMAASGVHLAMAVLVKDRMDSESDSLQEDWADPETMATLVEELPFEKGKLEVKIFDELSKIQINALVDFPGATAFNEKQHQIWDRFAGNLLSVYELLGDEIGEMEETDAPTVINSVKDWIDKDDDITSINSAESDYYEELDPPYACKNAPFDAISEVRLVKGITPELFNGIAGAMGLSNYITVYGAVKAGDDKFSYPGKININTAELPVLKVLLPSESEDMAELLIAYREAVSGTLYTNDVTNINWYKNVPGFGSIKLDPELISVSSDTFRIVATATLDDVRAVTTAVVQRERESDSSPWTCKVLNWKTD
ncbi:MAG: type II secretion system minor pseudopilin GspK [Desulfobacteraceae bacterium]|jgi:general secretion pathway protein K